MAHQVAQAFDHHNASLSEGEALAAVDGALPGKPYWRRVGNGFPASAATTVAGRRPACPRVGTWRRTGRGEEVEGATPAFSLLVHHRQGLSGGYNGAR